MKAALLNEVGGVPSVGEFDEPVAADGETVADVLVAALNPIDRLLAAGGPYGAPPIPSIVGREGVARLGDGTRVYFKDVRAPYGSIAERAPFNAAAAIPIPDGVDEAAAVAAGIAGTTAYGALKHRAALQPDETVLVLGASGAAGGIAVQVAKLLGAKRVVAAARHTPALEALRDRGVADEIVTLTGDDAQALKAASDGGYDVVIDPLFGQQTPAALAATKMNGRCVVFGSLAGRQSTVSYGEILGKSLLGFVGAQVPPEGQRAGYLQLLDWIASGDLVVSTRRLPIEQVSDAWEALAASPHHKLVIEP
ncbi:quinone oxidoreductase family protein [Nocardia miyunensis]|uniref:quinone oxidoreductase family protein n=1 Tax=Nocardia miyunensis TaxID=282684 RepID=UPI00082FCED0|nr:zinc-binding dehydrogenase [Nocardia miyunensis]